MAKSKYIESSFISRSTIVEIATEICKRRKMVNPENIEAIISGMEIIKIILLDKFEQKVNEK